MTAPLVGLSGLLVFLCCVVYSRKLDRQFWEEQRRIDKWDGQGSDPLHEMERIAARFKLVSYLGAAGAVIGLLAFFFVEPTGKDKQEPSRAERMP